MERKDRIDATGAAMLIAITLAMSIGQVLIKPVNAGMQPVFQAGLRSACAFPFVLAFAVLTGRRLGIRDGSLLCVLTERSTDIGAVAYEMAVFSEKAGDMLTPEVREELKADLVGMN